MISEGNMIHTLSKLYEYGVYKEYNTVLSKIIFYLLQDACTTKPGIQRATDMIGSFASSCGRNSHRKEALQSAASCISLLGRVSGLKIKSFWAFSECNKD